MVGKRITVEASFTPLKGHVVSLGDVRKFVREADVEQLPDGVQVYARGIDVSGAFHALDCSFFGEEE